MFFFERQLLKALLDSSQPLYVLEKLDGFVDKDRLESELDDDFVFQTLLFYSQKESLDEREISHLCLCLYYIFLKDTTFLFREEIEALRFENSWIMEILSFILTKS